MIVTAMNWDHRSTQEQYFVRCLSCAFTMSQARSGDAPRHARNNPGHQVRRVKTITQVSVVSVSAVPALPQ
jgi:hypothetical protein